MRPPFVRHPSELQVVLINRSGMSAQEQADLDDHLVNQRGFVIGRTAGPNRWYVRSNSRIRDDPDLDTWENEMTGKVIPAITRSNALAILDDLGAPPGLAGRL